MDITEKNGQPSMEEILASIRRIIAEEPSAPPPGIEIAPKALALQAETAFDEPSDFDLPSIFRTPAPAPEKPALFGRLTDAIRGATSSPQEPKSGRNGEELSAADHSDPITNSGRNGTSPVQYPALSSLKSVRPESSGSDARHQDTAASEPAKTPPAPPGASPLPAPSSFSGWFGRTQPPPPAIQEEIKRVMTPFKDMRFRQMGHDDPAAPESHSAPAALPIAPQPPQLVQPPEPQRVDFASIIPARLDMPGIPAVEEHRWPPVGHAQEAAFGMPQRVDYPGYPPEPPHYTAEPIATTPRSPAPLAPGYYDPSTAGRLPGSNDEQVVQFRPQAPAPAQAPNPATGTIEDTTAELLRPMLRAWLADNMPRMVEKALHIEVAESVRPGRKPPGQ